jgi:hypothetical protein
MPLVLDELQEIGVNVRIEGKEAEALQNKLSAESESGANWKRLKWDENNIPKMTKEPKSNDSDRLRLLELEMEMEIAIMEMELEIGKFKSVAGL